MALEDGLVLHMYKRSHGVILASQDLPEEWPPSVEYANPEATSYDVPSLEFLQTGQGFGLVRTLRELAVEVSRARCHKERDHCQLV